MPHPVGNRVVSQSRQQTWDRRIATPILQIRKQRLRRTKWHACYHTAPEPRVRLGTEVCPILKPTFLLKYGRSIRSSNSGPHSAPFKKYLHANGPGLEGGGEEKKERKLVCLGQDFDWSIFPFSGSGWCPDIILSLKKQVLKKTFPLSWYGLSIFWIDPQPTTNCTLGATVSCQ